MTTTIRGTEEKLDDEAIRDYLVENQISFIVDFSGDMNEFVIDGPIPEGEPLFD